MRRVLLKSAAATIVVLAVSLWLPIGADANSSILEGAHPGIVFPIHSDRIKLVRERVDVFVEWLYSRMQVVSVMELQNLGEADTVIFGYPEDYQEYRDWSYEERWKAPYGYRLNNFGVSIDGHTLPYTRKTGQDAPGLFNARSWLVWDVPFEANQTRTLVVTYNTWGEGDMGPGSDIQRFEYVVGTANSYCDTPDRIEIQFHARLLSPERCTGITEIYYTPEDFYQTNFVWTRESVRPNPEEIVAIDMRLPFSAWVGDATWQRYCAIYNERKLPAEALRGLATELRNQGLLPEYRLCGILLNSDHPETATARELFADRLLDSGWGTVPHVYGPIDALYNFLRGFTDTVEIEQSVEECSDSTPLMFWRNTIYAQHGYPFRDPWWREFFEKTDWYSPLTEAEWAANPNPFSSKEQLLIDAIRERERHLTAGAAATE